MAYAGQFDRKWTAFLRGCGGSGTAAKFVLRGGEPKAVKATPQARTRRYRKPTHFLLDLPIVLIALGVLPQM
jgi:hypothetical protein